MKLRSNKNQANRVIKRSWWRKKKVIAILLLCLLLAWAIKTVSQPVTGHNVAVDVQLKKPSNASAQKQTPASHSANSYYKLDLPPGYQVQAASTEVPGLVVSQLVSKPGSLGSLIINIAVKTMPEGGWQNDSSYRLRQQKPDQFTMSTQTKGGDQLTISRDNQTASLVVFWPHAGYLATIGISSSIDNPSSDEIRQENSVLTRILDAWQWL